MKLADSDILRLLPPHIASDPAFAAAGKAIEPGLKALAKAIPSLLIFARLGEANPDQFLPPLKRLTDARGGLDPLGTGLLETLAWQFHVDFREAAKNDAQLAGMVRQSIAWHRIKGTPASIRAALALFGYRADFDEHTQGMPWACWMLRLDGTPNHAALADMAKIASEMQPARSRLWRVYNDLWDLRPGIASESQWSEALWSDFSGVYLPEIPGLDERGLMASFGARNAFLAQSAWADFGAGLGIAETMGVLIPWIQVPIWGHDLWSDAIQRYYGFFSAALLSALVAEASGLGQADWDARDWNTNTWANRKFYGRRTPPWTIFDVGIAKSEGVASEPSAPDGLWGELNANWSRPFYEILPDPDLWSAADWSGEQKPPKRIYILEQIAELKSEPLPALDPASPKPLSGTSCAEFAVAGPVPTWGVWAYPSFYNCYRCQNP